MGKSYCKNEQTFNSDKSKSECTYLEKSFSFCDLELFYGITCISETNKTKAKFGGQCLPDGIFLFYHKSRPIVCRVPQDDDV